MSSLREMLILTGSCQKPTTVEYNAQFEEFTLAPDVPIPSHRLLLKSNSTTLYKFVISGVFFQIRGKETKYALMECVGNPSVADKERFITAIINAKCLL